MRSGSLCEVCCLVELGVSLCTLYLSAYCPMHLSLQVPWTPLMWASRNGHTECVKVLLERGAQVNMQDKVSAVKD